MDDSKSLYRKWLFHQTSIYKWLFGVPGSNLWLRRRRIPISQGSLPNCPDNSPKPRVGEAFPRMLGGAGPRRNYVKNYVKKSWKGIIEQKKSTTRWHPIRQHLCTYGMNFMDFEYCGALLNLPNTAATIHFTSTRVRSDSYNVLLGNETKTLDWKMCVNVLHEVWESTGLTESSWFWRSAIIFFKDNTTTKSLQSFAGWLLLYWCVVPLKNTVPPFVLHLPIRSIWKKKHHTWGM